ncbi:MAG: hypothetical protein Ct9H90mP15_09170 [Candidatus Neomarinimicrobiota bacterium]|nr:MAG: hypothetical protein Ct9H90mP15_09170 [Candidatus Neomarinimicrobiota bacterium]
MLPPEIVINFPETDSIYASGQSISFDISATDDFAIEGIFLEIGDTEILSEYFFDSPIGGLMPTEYDIIIHLILRAFVVNIVANHPKCFFC